jgi:hypothetical protein
MSEILNNLGRINSSEIRLRNIKNIVFGLPGSGKTYFSKAKCKEENLTVLVYSPHFHDFKDETDNFIYFKHKDFLNDFDEFLKYAIELGKQKQIDLLLIDEFDMLFKSGKTMTNTFIDFNGNHRHYNLGALFLARRPQDIDASTVEACEFLVGFSIFGDNVKQKLNRIYKGYGEMVQSLTKASHQAVVLEIGSAPKLMQPIGSNTPNIAPVQEKERAICQYCNKPYTECYCMNKLDTY